MADVRSVRVVISGTVQGVGYRDWTQREARALGLTGWVRNFSDGSVEAVFSGLDNAVMKMVAACQRGPPAARVDQVVVGEAEAVTGDFAIRATGSTLP